MTNKSVKDKMELVIEIEKIDDSISVPMGEEDAVQFRSDGIMLNGELHFWEQILTVMITNRGLLRKLRERK